LVKRTWKEKVEIIKKTLYLNAKHYEIVVDGKVAIRKGSSGGSNGQVKLKEPSRLSRLFFGFVSLLPDLMQIILLKEIGTHFHLLRFRMVVPAGTEVETIIYVDAAEVWEIWGEKHDVPHGVFEHGCWKDGMVMFEPMLIEGDNLTMDYRIPFIIWEKIRGHIRNTTTTDETFRLSVERVVYPRKVYRFIATLLRPFKVLLTF